MKNNWKSKIRNAKDTMQAFYNVDKVSLRNIDNQKLTEIINRSKKINELFNSKEFKFYKIDRYLKIMKLIHSNYRENNAVVSEYATTSQAEKFLLFMFSIDPNFEMAIIYASEDRINEAKAKIIEKFEVFDPYLIKIEKVFIKNFLTPEKRNEINEEIEKRAFK